MPVSQFKFTKATLAELTPSPDGKRLEVRDVTEPTLRLQVTATGRKSFYGYGWNPALGQPIRERLGTFDPDQPAAMTVARARAAAKNAGGRISGGANPAAERREARQAAQEAETVADLAKDWIERHAKVKRRERTWREYQRILDADVIPTWGGKPATSITRKDVNRLLDRVAIDRGSPVGANRVLSAVRAMYNHGIRRGIVEANPATLIERPGVETPRERALSTQEIRALWEKLDTAPLSPQTALALKLILITAQRPGEVAGARWDEIDGAWWTIPGERTKNRRTHRVYLGRLAGEILKIAKVLSDGKTHVLSTVRDQHLRGDALPKAVGRCGHFGLERWTPHDLRRTASTLMVSAKKEGGCGCPPADVDRVLNHTDSSVRSRHYDSRSFDHEKRKALTAWDRRLGEIVSGEAAGKVVAISRGAA